MKQYQFLILCICGLFFMTSCNHHETYADQKKKERSAINAFIAKSNIKVISEATFNANGYKTNVSSNEYVLFESTGVYMQIVREGCGEKIKNGETMNVLCRYDEYNLLTDSIISSNNMLVYSSRPDKMSVSNSYGTFTASFTYGVMAETYGSSVPSGWLVPFTYIKVGRPVDIDDEIALVKLIVPHSEGQSYASQNVYPCFYEITYERGV